MGLCKLVTAHALMEDKALLPLGAQMIDANNTGGFCLRVRAQAGLH